MPRIIVLTEQEYGSVVCGRHLSVYNGKEFRCAEMHAEFCRIRKKMANGRIPGFYLCSAWKTNENGVRYKEYWFGRENG